MAITTTPTLQTMDTKIDGYPAQTMPIDSINWMADWVVRKQTPTEVILVNSKVERDVTETFRFALNTVGNAYTGSNVDQAYAAPSKRGQTLLIQYTGVVTYLNQDAKEIRLPVSAHTVVKAPLIGTITPQLITKLWQRLIGGTQETGKNDFTRISALLAGSLVPKGL